MLRQEHEASDASVGDERGRRVPDDADSIADGLGTSFQVGNTEHGFRVVSSQHDEDDGFRQHDFGVVVGHDQSTGMADTAAPAVDNDRNNDDDDDDDDDDDGGGGGNVCDVQGPVRQTGSAATRSLTLRDEVGTPHHLTHTSYL